VLGLVHRGFGRIPRELRQTKHSTASPVQALWKTSGSGAPTGVASRTLDLAVDSVADPAEDGSDTRPPLQVTWTRSHHKDMHNMHLIVPSVKDFRPSTTSMDDRLARRA
jgi:hypothetical protein